MIPFAMFAMPAVSGSCTVPGGAAVTSFCATQASLIPLILVALLVDGAIVTIWYMFGYVLGNAAVRQSARSEFYQLIGTALLIAIIAGALVVFGGFFQGALNNTHLLSQGALSNVCQNQISGSPFTALSGFSALLCPIVEGKSTTDPVTAQIDYPLAASGVVIENLTNQAVTNVNSFFVVDTYIGFLSTLSPMTNICILSIPDTPECLLPIPEPPPAFFLGVSYTPYAGLNFVYTSMSTLGILLMSSLYSFIIQLSFITVFLYAWPFLIFTGLLLRSNFITRKLGGLFIAIAIGVVFFFPVIFAIQYLSLGNGLGSAITSSMYGPIFGPGSISSIYGYNGLPTNAITELPGNDCVTASTGAQQCGVYAPNFYVFPNVELIANSYGCWPPNGDSAGALDAEVADIAFLWVPGAGGVDALSALAGTFLDSYPTIYLPYQCSPESAGSLLFAYVNMYGVYGISGYLLPILDILITLTAIIGLSSLLGGDTSLGGLGRLI